MPNTPFPLGVYVGDPNGSDASAEATFEANYSAFSTLLGAKPQFLDVCTDQTQSISQWVSNASWEAWSMAQLVDTTSDDAGVTDNPTFVQWLSNTLQNAGVPVT